MPVYIGKNNGLPVVGLTKTSQDAQNIKQDTVFHSSLPYVEVVEHVLGQPDRRSQYTLYANGGAYSVQQLQTSQGGGGSLPAQLEYYAFQLPEQVRNFLLYTRNQFMIQVTWTDGRVEILPPLQVTVQNSNYSALPDVGTLFQQDSPWLLSGQYTEWYFSRSLYAEMTNQSQTWAYQSDATYRFEQRKGLYISSVSLLELKGLQVDGQGNLVSQALGQGAGQVLIDKDRLIVGNRDFKQVNFLAVFKFPTYYSYGNISSASWDTRNTQITKLFQGYPSFSIAYPLDQLTNNNQQSYGQYQGSNMDYTLSNPYKDFSTVFSCNNGQWIANQQWQSFGGWLTEGVNPVNAANYQQYKIKPQSGGWGFIGAYPNSAQQDSYLATFTPSQGHYVPPNMMMVGAFGIASLSKAQGIVFDSRTPSINQGANYKLFDWTSGLVSRVGNTYRCVDSYFFPFTSGQQGVGNTQVTYPADVVTVVGRIYLTNEEAETNNFFLLPLAPSQKIRSRANFSRGPIIGIQYRQTNPGDSRYIGVRLDEYGGQNLAYRLPSNLAEEFRGRSGGTDSTLGFTPPGFTGYINYIDDSYFDGYNVPVKPLDSQNFIRNVSIISLPVETQYILEEQNLSQEDYPSRYRQGVISTRTYLVRVSANLIEVRLAIRKARTTTKSSSGTGSPSSNAAATNCPQVAICPIL